MMKRRVVVTGMGCVTPLGNDVESMWLAQKNCGNGVGQITHFDASHFPTHLRLKCGTTTLNRRWMTR